MPMPMVMGSATKSRKFTFSPKSPASAIGASVPKAPQNRVADAARLGPSSATTTTMAPTAAMAVARGPSRSMALNMSVKTNAERRSHLVLHHLHAGPVPDHLVAVLQRAAAGRFAHVQDLGAAWQ